MWKNAQHEEAAPVEIAALAGDQILQHVGRGHSLLWRDEIEVSRFVEVCHV